MQEYLSDSRGLRDTPDEEFFGAERDEELNDLYKHAGHCRTLFSFASAAGGLHLSMRLKEELDGEAGGKD